MEPYALATRQWPLSHAPEAAAPSREISHEMIGASYAIVAVVSTLSTATIVLVLALVNVASRGLA